MENLNLNKPDFRDLDLTAGAMPPQPTRRSSVTPANFSGELSNSRSNNRHRRSASAGSPLIHSGGGTSSGSSGGSNSSNGGITSGSVSSPNIVLYPTGNIVKNVAKNVNSFKSGNICPSGVVTKGNMVKMTRHDTLGSGTGNYGHGSIVRGGPKVGPDLVGPDPEEVKREGNEMYKKGNFSEALALYDKAISMSPENAAYRSNRAAALTMMGRLWEAVRECEVAVKIDSGYRRAHQRLASLFLRLGQVENARHHLCYNGQPKDKSELQRLLLVEKHINQYVDARKISDWKSVLRECEAATVAGADSSPQINACKGEAFLKLRQLENADSSLSSIVFAEPYSASCLQIKCFGMILEAYLYYVRALVDMAFGRFENAMAAAEKASKIDRNNIEIAILLNNVKLVTRARSRGKDLFEAGRFSEASIAYGDGLRCDLSNSVLYCNRAICWSKLGLWEKSVEDCNQALKFQPNYTKALLRRAVSNAKLERWGEAVRDYEVLKKELPGDSGVGESLLRAQTMMKKLQLGGNTRAS